MNESQALRTVEIVDDHFLFGQALASVVAEHAAWTVLGIAVTGPQALGIAKERQPDVILLDFHLPGVTADMLIPRLRGLAPQAKIIVLTSDTSDATRSTALAVGADGFMTKDSAIEEVIEAMTTVLGSGARGSPEPAAPFAEPALAALSGPTTAFRDATTLRPRAVAPAGPIILVERATFASLAAFERRLETQRGIRAAWVRAFGPRGVELRLAHDAAAGDLDGAIGAAAGDLSVGRIHAA